VFLYRTDEAYPLEFNAEQGLAAALARYIVDPALRRRLAPARDKPSCKKYNIADYPGAAHGRVSEGHERGKKRRT
jgi:hypothetical protein